MGKRQVIFKIIKRIWALIKSCAENKQSETVENKRKFLNQSGAQQRSLLGFFAFDTQYQVKATESDDCAKSEDVEIEVNASENDEIEVLLDHEGE